MIMTALGRHLTPETMAAMQARVAERAALQEEQGGKRESSDGPPQMKFKSVAAGAATQVFAATSPELDGHGGAYLADCQLGVAGGNPAERGIEAHAADPVLARTLWAASEQWVGRTFGG
jgi:hypothetical protein